MRIYVKGMGCSSSLADAEVLAGCLKKAGHLIVEDARDAELLVYNTCAVKAPTEDRVLSLLRRTSKEQRLVVAGCLPLINFERLKSEVHFDGAVGPALGRRIVKVVEEVSRGLHVERLERGSMNMPGLSLPRVPANPIVSIIPISYGCLGSCAYCCVRFARGRLRSYSVEEILRRVEMDVRAGAREFWLTAQDSACYGRDIGVNLAELLREICGLDGDFLIRVGMMTPNSLLDMLDEVLEAFLSEKVFKFLHVPVQSGNEGVLKLMNRAYKVEDFVEIVGRFRGMFPRSTVATDLIVGFPGETDAAFEDTLSLVERVRPDIVNVSKFFRRPKTSMWQQEHKIAPSQLKQRSARLAGLARRVALEQNAGWIGWNGRILVDEKGKPGSAVGRNSAYKPVVIRGNSGDKLLGHFVSIKVVNSFQSHLLGKIA